ncbi:MAG: 6-carboxytetrahydropterin synthase [Flavobacteriales bacterium]|nr:6-carboxytetrahydropterin synthase [Flavobacteriales bacterium]
MSNTSMSKKLVYITRRSCFNAAHKLWNEHWSSEKNHEVFGKCANENWHGHNFYLFVTVKGYPDPDTGYSINFSALKAILKEYVEDPIDHKNLNLDVPWMEGQLTTMENLIVAIWDRIKKPIKDSGCELHALKLCESENNYAEYFGGE